MCAGLRISPVREYFAGVDFAVPAKAHSRREMAVESSGSLGRGGCSSLDGRKMRMST